MSLRRSRTALLLALVLLVARGTEANIISLGYFHSCAVLTSGTVMCWGFNSNGQLGDGTTTTRVYFFPPSRGWNPVSEGTMLPAKS